MKKTLMALALAAIASPIVAQASESNGIGYDYAQLDYVYQDNDGYHADGGTLSGSYGFTDNFFMFGEYGKLSGDESGFRGNDKHWSLGAGFNAAVGSRADWVTRVGYDRHRVEISFDGFSAHDHGDGGYVTTGVMGRVTDKLIANAYLGYQQFTHSDGDGNAFADFGMVYSFNPTWGLHAGFVANKDAETGSVGVRASF